MSDAGGLNDDARVADEGHEPPADTTADLTRTVMQAAEDDPNLSDDARLLLLTAMTGDDELKTELTGHTTNTDGEPAPRQTGTPAGAFLKSITVAGFRGVGPEARLDLTPAPGLVIVAGRNGSGKSTFSEAVEVSMTRTSYRWDNKPKAWKAGWRNLHASDPCRVEVELAEEGVGTTTVAAEWAPDTELDGGSHWVQRNGQKRDTSKDPLGWSVPMETYRPLLSYDELGGILEAEPSKLYDKLSAVLGLGQIADAQEWLDEQVKETGAPRREANKLVKQVLEELASSPDSRAAEAHTLLKARKRDLDAIEQLATGVSSKPPEDLTALRKLAALTVPSLDDVQAAVEECDKAQHSLAQASGMATDSLVRRSRMLEHALEHVVMTGAGSCPVCGVGTLDDEWAARAQKELSELKEQTAALREAERAHSTALSKLRGLLGPVPSTLQAEIDADLPSRSATADAWRAVQAVDVSTSTGPQEHVDAFTTLESNVTELRREADAERQRREDLWSPLARRLIEVVSALRSADEADQRGAVAKAAATWLKEHGNELRNERLRPISEHAQQIWGELRQESNVDLGPIQVSGSKTRRQVQLSAEVDGEEAGALTVMSQGELHALALALFLPRATLPASPFQFVVVDDPVQAMDPAKVDGLARVLERISRTHQVVVFTHDDRLPAATRYLGIDARILRVDRTAGSRVEVTDDEDPTRRYLSDAKAVALDPNANDEVRRRVIPVLCRLAVENACRDLFMARRFGRGDRRADVERAWEDTRTSRQALALALRDDARADVNGWLRRDRRLDAAMRVIGRGAHDGLLGDAAGAVDDVRLLVARLRANAP
ncbi:AAA family ATPase [Phytoactinopolyspora halotolerans]|uniref:Nuclease SbcCD subunit C n=1 Tax=Phytoactinopolyspora halotolerans TaxID=1981512 RepID=A0A6L9SFE6_9ACTN|nr:AAA family ATPase [Phytoactinopolyspora halotolerans]NEE03783.1 recombinase RecF [Phytoactinopolyspora halotolerans]